MHFLILLLALVGTLAVFATTRRGREVAKRIGFRDWVSGAASSEDVAFLIGACDGDRAEAERRVEAQRERLPELSEAELYRRAIRKVMNDRDADDRPS